MLKTKSQKTSTKPIPKQKKTRKISLTCSKKKNLHTSPHQSHFNTQNKNTVNLSFTEAPLVHNKDLIRTIIKPNRMNFLNKVSDIYDLILAGISLPDFVEYFLGEALYIIQTNSRKIFPINFHQEQQKMSTKQTIKSMSQIDKININSRSEIRMNWKLDQFKKICLKIYENSDQQDLKTFLKIPLPILNRWGSNCITKSSDNSQIFNETTKNCINMRESGASRIKYFKNLVRKTNQFDSGSQNINEIQVIDRMNQKLNAYLNSYANKIPSQSIPY